MKRLAVLTVILVGLAAACGGDDAPPDVTPAPAGDPSDLDGEWTLVMLVEDGDLAYALPESARIDLTIAGTEIGGTAACNTFGGTITASGDGSAIVADLAQTEMACERPELMETEQRYLAGLGATTTWVLEDGQLSLVGPSSSLLFAPATATVDAALIGPTWRLDSFSEGSGPGGTVSNQSTMSRIRLTAFEDAARIESPCGVVGGSLVFEDGGSGAFSVALEADEIDEDCEEEDRMLARELLDRLNLVVAYDIEGPRLVLSSPDGPLLGFTAN